MRVVRGSCRVGGAEGWVYVTVCAGGAAVRLATRSGFEPFGGAGLLVEGARRTDGCEGPYMCACALLWAWCATHSRHSLQNGAPVPSAAVFTISGCCILNQRSISFNLKSGGAWIVWNMTRAAALSLGTAARPRRVHLRIIRSLRCRISTMRSQLADLSFASSAASTLSR